VVAGFRNEAAFEIYESHGVELLSQ